MIFLLPIILVARNDAAVFVVASDFFSLSNLPRGIIAGAPPGSVIASAVNHQLEDKSLCAWQSHSFLSLPFRHLQIASQIMILLLTLILVARNDGAVVVTPQLV
jgi:hypothetical protein